MTIERHSPFLSQVRPSRRMMSFASLPHSTRPCTPAHLSATFTVPPRRARLAWQMARGVASAPGRVRAAARTPASRLARSVRALRQQWPGSQAAELSAPANGDDGVAAVDGADEDDVRLAGEAGGGGEPIASPVRRLPPSTFDLLGSSVSPRRDVPSPPSHTSPAHCTAHRR